MAWCPPKAVERLIQFPKLLWVGMEASFRRANDICFIMWEGSLYKCLFYVATLEKAFVANCKGCQESKFNHGHNGGVNFPFSPVYTIQVSECDDAVFGTLWLTMLIILDGADCHARKDGINFMTDGLEFIV